MAERPTFFVDRCLGGKIVVKALRDAGASVEAHDDHFTQATLDVEWIPIVAERGCVILTKDKNIRRRHTEREALLLSLAKVFTLTSGNMRGADMAALFVTYLAQMEQIAVTQPAPFVYAVHPNDGLLCLHPTLPTSVDDASDTATDD